MQVKLIYNLPEDVFELNQAIKAREYAGAWWEVKRFIRDKLKYENLTIKQTEVLEKVRDLMIQEELDRHLPEE